MTDPELFERVPEAVAEPPSSPASTPLARNRGVDAPEAPAADLHAKSAAALRQWREHQSATVYGVPRESIPRCRVCGIQMTLNRSSRPLFTVENGKARMSDQYGLTHPMLNRCELRTARSLWRETPEAAIEAYGTEGPELIQPPKQESVAMMERQIEHNRELALWKPNRRRPRT